MIKEAMLLVCSFSGGFHQQKIDSIVSRRAVNPQVSHSTGSAGCFRSSVRK
jgi:hypothetical protein